MLALYDPSKMRKSPMHLSEDLMEVMMPEENAHEDTRMIVQPIPL